MIIFPYSDDPLLPYLGKVVGDYLKESELGQLQSNREEMELAVKWLKDNKKIDIDMDFDSYKFRTVEIDDYEYTMLLLKYVSLN